MVETTRPGRVEGKVALVTGAGGGIGRAAATALAAEGAAVCCLDIDGSAAAATARTLAEGGADASHASVDVTDEDSLRAAAVQARERFGHLDTVFANAGVPGAGTALGTDRQEWDHVLAVNLTGVWLTVKTALPHLLDTGGGSVIATSSIGGLVGVRNLAPYAAAKAGVIGLIRQVAVEYGPQGVRANVITPGTVRTPLTEDTFRDAGLGSSDEDLDDLMRRAARRYPLRRLGKVDEVAGTVVHLASDESAWTTGSVVVIDGGLTAS